MAFPDSPNDGDKFTVGSLVYEYSITARTWSIFQDLADESFYGKATENINHGDLVEFAGAQGSHFLIKRARIDAAGFKPEYIMGVAATTILNNTFGYVIRVGNVTELDTDDLVEGSILYADHEVPGRLLDSEPPFPHHSIMVGAVTRKHGTQGSIYVRVTHKPDIGELHDVKITEPTEGQKHRQMLTWDSDQNFWVNTTITLDYGTY